MFILSIYQISLIVVIGGKSLGNNLASLRRTITCNGIPYRIETLSRGN